MISCGCEVRVGFLGFVFSVSVVCGVFFGSFGFAGWECARTLLGHRIIIPRSCLLQKKNTFSVLMSINQVQFHRIMSRRRLLLAVKWNRAWSFVGKESSGARSQASVLRTEDRGVSEPHRGAKTLQGQFGAKESCTMKVCMKEPKENEDEESPTASNGKHPHQEDVAQTGSIHTKKMWQC